MIDLIELFEAHERLDPEQTKQKILTTDFATLELNQAVVLLAQLLLHDKTIPEEAFIFPTDTLYGERLMRLREKNNSKIFRALTNWFYVHSGRASALYPLYLYNIDYGKTRYIFNLLLKSEEGTPPYLYRILPNILRAYFPDEQIAKLIAREDDLSLWAPALNALFHRAGPVKQWLKTKDRSIHYYGGQTNTVLGMYDENFGPASGAGALNKTADVYYDLGGGYNTPEIDRLTGFKFTSLDILPPNTHTDGLILVRKTRQGEILIGQDEHQEYLDRLNQTPYIGFDVFKNTLPADHDSYVIVSTGFLTSTVRPSAGSGYRGRGFYATSLAGIKAVMQLIQQGKDVDLFTLSRATGRSYTHRTVMISFRAGKVTNLITTPESIDRFRLDRRNEVFSLIHPATSPYAPWVNKTAPEWACSGIESKPD